MRRERVTETQNIDTDLCWQPNANLDIHSDRGALGCRLHSISLAQVHSPGPQTKGFSVFEPLFCYQNRPDSISWAQVHSIGRALVPGWDSDAAAIRLYCNNKRSDQ